MKYLLLGLLSIKAFASFDWQGHRGARGLVPENTIEAMHEALKYPVTTLELDVVISKDNQVVVSHEPWMSPGICTSPGKMAFKEQELNLYQMNYSDILSFDCGSVPSGRFPRQKKMSVGKPLLSALLKDVEATLKGLSRNVSYNIEIKSDVDQEKKKFQPGVTKFSDLVMKEVLAFLPKERFTIQSFDPRVLIYLKGSYPEIKLSYLSEDRLSPEEVKKKLGFLPEIYSPDFKTLNYEDVPSFHAAGIKVIPWTVNDAQDMKKLMAMGVDGIITDYPDLIPEVIAKKCGRGSHLYEGKCVKVPTHALPSDNSPGWVCKKGYVQRRLRCDKINLPENSILLPDGKNWECEEGFEKYRGSCKKK